MNNVTPASSASAPATTAASAQIAPLVNNEIEAFRAKLKAATPAQKRALRGAVDQELPWYNRMATTNALVAVVAAGAGAGIYHYVSTREGADTSEA